MGSHAIVASACVALAACGSQDEGLPGESTCASEAAVTKDLAYASIDGVDPALTSLDLYVPALDGACTVPVVVWVHGGAWAVGDKAASIDDKVVLFNGAGYALASVNYRLSPSPPSGDPDRVMYPDHPNDVADAVGWLVAHGGEYHLDVARLALLGHSAGAHLVALLSTDESFLAERGLGLSAIACTGSFDTEAYDIPAAYGDGSAMQRAILENAFGTDPATHAEASPVTHVASGKAIPPFLVARRGGAERQATQQGFCDALVAAGVPCAIIDASSLDHEGVNKSIGAEGDAIMTPAIEGFLAGCL